MANEIWNKRIKTAERIYEKLENWKHSRDTITYFFENNKENDHFSIVLIKVVLINSLYWTQIKKPVEIAKKIYSEHKKIDKLLNKGNLEAVNLVALSGGERYELSFASKFCHFHNKEKYPIYDKYACKALEANLSHYKYNSQKKKCKQEYEIFSEKLREFTSKVGLDPSEFERVDTFLWLYGMKIDLDEAKEDGALKNLKLNQEIKDFFPLHRELFRDLD